MTTRWFSLAAASASLILALAQKTSAVSATGGDVTETNGYRIHTFTNSAAATNLVVTDGGNVEVLVVAGGGGGGNSLAGGGGAGGLIYTSAYTLVVGATNVSVGAGGAGAAPGAGNAGGTNGSNSVFGSLTAVGGGGGSGWNTVAAKNGGSGGGGMQYSGLTAGGAALPAGQGNVGGNSIGVTVVNYGGGGGGGAGSPGSNGTSTVAGNGGTGLEYPQFASVGGAPAGWFAGGGGGGTYTGGVAGTGGYGGGGNGGVASGNTAGSPGQTNTGGGGGTGHFQSNYGGGGKGGSGIVIVRYPTKPSIENRPATSINTSSAWLNGYLSSTGAAPVTISVYWGNTDCGTTSGLWQATNTLAGSGWTNGALLTSQATGLTANTYYYYRYYATNSFGEWWASVSERFLAGNITVTNTDSSAMEPPPDGPVTNTGILTIQRDPAAINEALTVYYAWGGTAGYGTTFMPSPTGTSVTLPVGVASTNITITPLWDPRWTADQSDKTVWLVLQSGAYGIGTSASNLVTIARYPFTAGANVTVTNGNWNATNTWSLGRRPVPGDDVTVKHAVLVTNSTDYLNTLTITNATLTFTNWSTILTASNVMILNGGILTHTTNSATNTVAGQWAPDARVYIVCANFTMATNSTINADYRGYCGEPNGSAVGGYGYGPGGGGPRVQDAISRGGSYGGLGAISSRGIYGSITNPVDPGSGGGARNGIGRGGNGGGAVMIEASGAVTVHGTITANGETTGSGTGSGGGINILCRTIAGSGIIRAEGGAHGGGGYSSGGGGGRIALRYDPAAQGGVIPALLCSAAGGLAANLSLPGAPGTVYYSDNSILYAQRFTSGQIEGFTNWAPDSLAITNGYWIMTNMVLTVTNNLLISGLGQLALTGPLNVGGTAVINGNALNVQSAPGGVMTVTVGGNFMLTNSATLYLYAAPTNGTTNYGGLVGVTGAMTIASGCTLYPYSSSTNGGSVLFRMADLLLASGGTIDASGKGYAGGTSGNGYGPGGGQLSVSAGGYGGKGNGAASGYGGTYGSSNAPVDPGSGGGGAAGGAGGGLVRMQITNTATISGSILANGTGNTLGGSGGGIHLSAAQFALAYGTIRADGGTGSSKGGGGGRIALTGWTRDGMIGTVSAAAGGAGAATGEVGTIVRQPAAGGWTLMVQTDPQYHGAASPYDYGGHVIADGTKVTNSITLTAEETNGFRYICRLWTLTNSAGYFASGSPTQAVFTITNNLFLTWYWTNQYYLAASAATNGTLLAPKTGWYTNGVTVQVQAVPDGGYEFLMWMGTGVPAGHQSDNPLDLTMDSARTVQAVFVPVGSAVTRIWTGTNNWFTSTNWSPEGLPAPGDSVIIRSGLCLLSDPTRVAGMVVSNGATLFFTNWNTSVQASNITVYGTITHATNSATTTNASGQWAPDARVYLICTNLTIATNGSLNVDYRGYRGEPGGLPQGGYGYGPGGGGPRVDNVLGIGGSYGGRGYNNSRGIYGSITNPVYPGSGGGARNGFTLGGGSGGGLVMIEASGAVTVEGSITANGGPGGTPSGCGTGSGGGINILCRTLAGSGIIQAEGGTHGGSASFSSGGGGGRIALRYDPAAQGGFTPALLCSAAGGLAANGSVPGAPGTVYYSDNTIIYKERFKSGQIEGFSSWSPDSLAITNGYWIMTNMALTVMTNFTIRGKGQLDLTGPLNVGGGMVLDGNTLSVQNAPGAMTTVTVGGDVQMMSAAQFYLYSIYTNAATTNYGALLTVGGTLLITTNSWIYPVSNPTNGGSPLIRTANLILPTTNCGINAYALGFLGGDGTGAAYGPGGAGGGSSSSGGGSHAGVGTDGNYGTSCGKIIYGNSNAPVTSGSGGSRGAPLNRGGGVIRLEVGHTAQLDGTLNANGGNSSVGSGAGGSVYLRCDTLRGSSGIARANGGDASSMGGAGGGGRVAIWRRYDYTAGLLTATASGGLAGGGHAAGGTGTVVWVQLPPSGTVLTIR